MPLQLPRSSVKSFAQQQLGCQCEAAVFEQITLSLEQLGDAVYQRICIGGRLLIYLADLSGRSDGETLAVELLDLGVKQRDNEQLNRFRLALLGLDERKMAFLARQVESDEKAHLHQLSEAQLRRFI